VGGGLGCSWNRRACREMEGDMTIRIYTHIKLEVRARDGRQRNVTHQSSLNLHLIISCWTHPASFIPLPDIAL